MEWELLLFPFHGRKLRLEEVHRFPQVHSESNRETSTSEVELLIGTLHI